MNRRGFHKYVGMLAMYILNCNFNDEVIVIAEVVVTLFVELGRPLLYFKVGFLQKITNLIKKIVINMYLFIVK